MQSRNKAVIGGLLIGAITWNSTRSLSYGIEAGALAGWAATLPDLDSAYEFTGDHAKYPPATQAIPFGRSITDRLHSRFHLPFFHSVAALMIFWGTGKVLTLLSLTSYAEMELILYTWVIFSLARYLFRTVLRQPLRSILRVTFVSGVVLVFVLWETLNGSMPGYGTLPATWFVFAWVGGFGGNIAMETLSARGAPLLWPIPLPLKIPVLGETGGVRESWAVGTFLIMWLLWWWNHDTSFHAIGVQFVLLGELLWKSVSGFLNSSP